MPYNYLIICNLTSARLLSRHFASSISSSSSGAGAVGGQASPAAHRVAAEDAALRALAHIWPKLAAPAPGLAFSSEQSSGGINLRKQVVTQGDQVILAARVGDLIVILSGSDETEEFQLSEGMDAVASVLAASMDPRRQQQQSGGAAGGGGGAMAGVTEVALMHPETLGKVCVAFDDLLPDGVLETTDVDTVMRMSKLKSFV